MHPPFLHFVREQRTPLPVIPTVQDCKGKTYVVTGANTGLGFECAQHFVHLGAKRVILACRSLSRGEAAKQRIEEATTIAGVVEVWHLDLGLYDSVSSFADRVQQLDRVDAIVENASLGFAQYTEAEGLETGLTVNVVGTFLLAVMVLPKLQECAKTFGSTPHLVVVGSEVEFGMEGQLEKLEGDLIYALNQYLKTSMSISYPISKLLQHYAVRELAQLRPFLENGVVINLVNPGACKTELGRNLGLGMRMFLAVFQFLFARTAEAGSRTLLQAAVAGPESHGKYLATCRTQEELLPSWMTNNAGEETQLRVWKSLSKKLESIQPGCMEAVLGSKRS